MSVKIKGVRTDSRGLDDRQNLNYVFTITDVIKYLYDFTIIYIPENEAHSVIDNLVYHYLVMVLNQKVSDNDKIYIELLFDCHVDLDIIYEVYYYLTGLINPAIFWMMTNIVDKSRLGLLYVTGNYAKIVSIQETNFKPEHYPHLIISTVEEYDGYD